MALLVILGYVTDMNICFRYNVSTLGNLARHSWDKIKIPGAQSSDLGHSLGQERWGTVGAQRPTI